MSESETREAEEAAADGTGEFDGIVFDSYRQTQPVPLEKKDGFSLGRNGWKKAFGVYLKNCDHPDLQEEIYFQNDDFMVVYDGYPKARHHLLLLPKTLFLGAEQPSSLRDTDLPKLRRLHALGNALAKDLARQGAEEVRCGYHALPSMEPLHLHIISQDFDSPSMRKKHHWNIFTTDIFLEPRWVEEALEQRGSLDLDVEKYTLLKEQMPRCHLCGQGGHHMLALKEHYRSHFEAQEIDAVQHQQTRQSRGSQPQQQNPESDSAGDGQPAGNHGTMGQAGRKRRRRRARGGQGKTAVEPEVPMEMAIMEEGVSGPQKPARDLLTDLRGQEPGAGRGREGLQLRQEALAECPGEQGGRGQGRWETSIGGIGGEEWCKRRRLHGPGHGPSIQENNRGGFLGENWAGGPGTRGNGSQDKDGQGWGSLGFYENREPTTRWPSAHEAMGHGGRGSYEEESVHLSMSGGLGLRTAGDLGKYTGGAGLQVPQGNQHGIPQNGGARQNGGWRGGRESVQRHGWQELSGSRPVGTISDRDGWHGRSGSEVDGQGRPGQEWGEDPRQGWNEGWRGLQRSPGAHREGERGGDAWHGLRGACGGGQAKAGQGHGPEWSEARDRAEWFGVPGQRGAEYGERREGRGDWLRGTCIDGSGRSPRGQGRGWRGVRNGAGWYGGQQLGVQHEGHKAGNEACGSLRGVCGTETGREDNLQGGQRRGERIWEGLRKEREQKISQERGNKGGHDGWQGVAGAGVDGQGERGETQGFGKGWAGGHGGQVWHRMPDELWASVGEQQREQQMQRANWMGGRADGGWRGREALQGTRVQEREGRKRRVDDQSDDGARVRARWAEGRLNGSEHHSLKRVRAGRIGAADNRTMEGTRGRSSEGQEEQGVDRNALGERGKGIRSWPPEKLP